MHQNCNSIPAICAVTRDFINKLISYFLHRICSLQVWNCVACQSFFQSAKARPYPAAARPLLAARAFRLPHAITRWRHAIAVGAPVSLRVVTLAGSNSHLSHLNQLFPISQCQEPTTAFRETVCRFHTVTMCRDAHVLLTSSRQILKSKSKIYSKAAFISIPGATVALCLSSGSGTLRQLLSFCLFLLLSTDHECRLFSRKGSTWKANDRHRQTDEEPLSPHQLVS